MIHFDLPSAWSRRPGDNYFGLLQVVDSGIERISVVAEGWTRSMRQGVELQSYDVGVKFDSTVTAAVPLIWIGGSVMATIHLPEKKGRCLRLRASSPAEIVTWITPAIALRAPSLAVTLPDCMNAAIPTPESPVESDRTPYIVEYLSVGDLERALDEFGLICLQGSRQNMLVAANLILLDLALHPFRRSPRLGAFVGALCVV